MASFWSKDFWPPSSSDLKPLDYFWWCTIESKTNHTSHGSLDSLKAAIARKWNDFAKENIRRACATSEAILSHASWQTKANQVKMFRMPTPCVYLNFKPNSKYKSYTKLDFLSTGQTILPPHPVHWCVIEAFDHRSLETI